MAGHSKWANIRHRKQSVDLKKSQQFHKVVKELQIALTFGDNPKTNAQLRKALTKAKAVNLPKKTITKLFESKHLDLNKKEDFFLAGGQFAKKVLLLFQLSLQQQKHDLNELQKLASKSQLEVLPFSAVVHTFLKVIALTFTSLSEKIFQQIVDQFQVHDFVATDQQMIIYFADFESVKKVRTFLEEKQVTAFTTDQIFLPKIKVKITDSLKEELILFKNKVFSTIDGVSIVDNVEQ